MSDIKISSVNIKSEGKVLFSNLSLEIPDGRFTLVRGGKGSGRFLLLKIIGGILEPDTGSVTIDNHDVYNYLANLNIKGVPSAFIFQNGALISNLSIAENLILPLDFHFPLMTLSEKKAKIDYYLNLFGLKNILDKRPFALSDDILKVVGIIRAFIVEPGLIIMHEPYDYLEDEHIEVFEKLVENKFRTGTSFIVASRSYKGLNDLANYIVELYEHKIEWSGSLDDFRKNLTVNDI